ncbi:hypothetical protein OG547_24365 [Streptomyces longwoodensis]|uniref:hypothetical protein n=1 Tax=Streptomyces longwoodensis TaxID=68231 RepID=UPI00225338B2|nr:hypothetical protein [Streptomyces longwoodensis]MCX4998597.1 hypothetical protein [Streptomyces longwoodensis]WTI47412.1 hypothetical protein OG547_24365 [Streptomyces longwoodensis]
MRIRSALAAVVLTAVSAATASAADHEQRGGSDDGRTCSTYLYYIDTVTADLGGAGTNCGDLFFA